MSRQLLFVLAVAAVMQPALFAHRQWMLPSATVVAPDDNSWVTVDAAVSNELFYFDHVAMRNLNLVITAPDGSLAKAENMATGRYRTTFDVRLAQKGTYRIANVSKMAFATWTENGQQKSWRGAPDAMAKEVPAGAEGLKVSRMSNRVELFVTSGKPDRKALEPTGFGLELIPVTHPNDLVTGEKASFRFVDNGKPAAGLEVTIIPGGIRYRDQLKEQKIKTDAEGKFSVELAEPGMYWINASTGAGGRGPGGPGGPGGRGPGGPEGVGRGEGRGEGGRGPGGPGGRGMMMPMGDRSSYAATLEVLPQ